jgi:hypothetical protein
MFYNGMEEKENESIFRLLWAGVTQKNGAFVHMLPCFAR